MDRFAGMAVYVKVVESSSFAAAARHFRMSPAMVSNHIRAIEERLGVRLLNRTTRRVSPTEIGQKYYARCVRILAELDEAETAARDSNTTPQGLLRVTAPFTFGIAHVAPAIADYLATYPDVAVDLMLDDRYVDLIEEGIDIAIRVGQLPDSSLMARRIATTQTVVCASQRYLERHGTPRVLTDLARHNCLSYSPSAARNEWRFINGSGETEVAHVSGRFRANNGDVLRVLALEGAGIVRLPIFTVEADLASGRLRRLLPDYEAVETPVSAIYPHGRFLSAKLRTFVDVVGTHMERTLGARRPGNGARHLAAGLHAG